MFVSQCVTFWGDLLVSECGLDGDTWGFDVGWGLVCGWVCGGPNNAKRCAR